jgi:dCTP diphosphatase
MSDDTPTRQGATASTDPPGAAPATGRRPAEGELAELTRLIREFTQ